MSLQNESSQPESSQPELGAKKGLNMLAESVYTSSPLSHIQAVNSESWQEQSSIVLSPKCGPACKLIQVM